MRSQGAPLSEGIPAEGQAERVYVGCDLGIATVKVALIANDRVLAWNVLPYTNLPKQAAVDLLEQALGQGGVTRERVSCCLATGLGTLGLYLGMAAGMAFSPMLVAGAGLHATMLVFAGLTAQNYEVRQSTPAGFFYFQGLLDQVGGRRCPGDEGKGTVFINRDIYRDDRTCLLGGSFVILFAECHDVQAVLPERRAYRGGRICLAGRYLQFNYRFYFFSHFIISGGKITFPFNF